MSCRPAPFSCRPSGRGAVLSFEFYTKLSETRFSFFNSIDFMMTYIVLGDAMANVVSGLLKGAIVA